MGVHAVFAIVGVLVGRVEVTQLVVYAIVPIIRLTTFSNSTRYDDIVAKRKEPFSFRVKYAWAFAKYRKSGSEKSARHRRYISELL